MNFFINQIICIEGTRGKPETAPLKDKIMYSNRFEAALWLKAKRPMTIFETVAKTCHLLKDLIATLGAWNHKILI